MNNDFDQSKQEKKTIPETPPQEEKNAPETTQPEEGHASEAPLQEEESITAETPPVGVRIHQRLHTTAFEAYMHKRFPDKTVSQVVDLGGTFSALYSTKSKGPVTEDPRISTLDAICGRTGVSADYLLGYSDLVHVDPTLLAAQEVLQLRADAIDTLRYLTRELTVKTNEQILDPLLENDQSLFTSRFGALAYHDKWTGNEMMNELLQKENRERVSELIILMQQLAILTDTRDHMSIMETTVHEAGKKRHISDEDTDLWLSNIAGYIPSSVLQEKIDYLFYTISRRFTEMIDCVIGSLKKTTHQNLIKLKNDLETSMPKKPFDLPPLYDE